ncbi:MAG: DUF445 domain-containing protein [Pseudomonadota bacterium]
MKAPPLPNDVTEDAKRARLKKTRGWAGFVLVTLVALYVATFIPDETPTWLRLVRHMAEAGMIGALADWFAVVALFRHPLGIPIPHTALLPRSKARAARSVGEFFKSYFLDPVQISARVAELAPARRAAEWLQTPSNAVLVAKPLTEAISIAMRSDKTTGPLNKGLRRELRGAIASKQATSGLTSALGPALEKAVSGPLMNDMLAQMRMTLDNNRDRVLELVQDKSRWWVASRVDRGVSTVLVDGLISVIGDLEDPKSDIRKDFEKGLQGFLSKLRNNGALSRAVHDGKASFAKSKAFDEAVDSTISLIREKLSEGLSRDPKEAEAAIAGAIESFARKLLSDHETLQRFETQLASSAESAIIELRDPIGNYVTDVIDGWEAEELSERFELEIGPDLQFIRINGAVLGALIGGVLFFVGQALSQL